MAANDSSNRSDALGQTFTMLFSGHPLPMWIYDLETLAFLEVNDAAVARYGYSRAEFLKMRITDIRPAEDVARLLRESRKARPPIQHSGEWRHRLRDGQLIDVEITSGTLVFGGRQAALVVVRDITERKQAEETRARLAAIVASSADAILSTTLDGMVLTWNTGAERLYGYAASEAIGQSNRLFVPPDKVAELLAIFERVGRGERVESFETRRMRRDGSPVDISLTVSPITDSAGRVTGASAIARDITERKRAEAELRRLNEEIHAQRVRVFRATMTTVHDIVNNLLNGLQLIRFEAEGRVSDEVVKLFDAAIADATAKLRALGNLQTVQEKEMATGLGIEYPGSNT